MGHQYTDSILLAGLPVHIISFLGLPYKEEEIVLPALRVYISFEEDKWFFGKQAILQELQRIKLISLDSLKGSVFAEEGKEFALQEVEPLMHFLFQHPSVFSKARP